ncbi:MAG: hypothetical protein AAF410_01625 [Pseudomonadota bacterium]
MNLNKKGPVGIVDIMLMLGCLGAIEMLIVIFFWADIALNDSLKLLRPDQPLETLSLIAFILGFVGLFNYAFGLFTDMAKPFIYRNKLALAFVFTSLALGFCYVIY